MKRIVFILLFLCAGFFFWQDLLGLCVKGALRLAMKAQLAYRELHISNGQLVLEDAVLFDVSGGKSAYLLRADTIRIEWKRVSSFFVGLDKGCLTLSSEIFKNHWSLAPSRFTYELDISDGVIDWSDGFLPPATFSYIDDKLDLSWEKGGTLVAHKTESGFFISGSNLPLHFMVPKAQGILDATMGVAIKKGSIATLSLQAEGKELIWDAELFRYGGSFSLDWTAKDVASFHIGSLFRATDRFRFNLKQGSIDQTLHDGNFLATFQSGLGGKLEGMAKTREGLPLRVEAKVFDGKQLRAFGTALFGEAQAVLVQTMDAPACQWQLEWTGLGVKEISSIQEVVSKFDPRIFQGEWKAGTANGTLQWDVNRKWELLKFFGRDLELSTRNVYCAHSEVLQNSQSSSGRSIGLSCKNLSFQKGNWNVEDLQVKTWLPVILQGNGAFELGGDEGAKGSWEGRLGESPVRIFYDRGRLFGSVGEFIFDGKNEGLERISIPRFGGRLPTWIGECQELSTLALSGGRISSLEEGFLASIDGSWSLACRLENCGFQYPMDLLSCKLTDVQCELYANPDEVDLIAVRGSCELLTCGNSFTTQLIAPRIHWSDDHASFDVRLTDREWDFLRVAGTSGKGRIEIDPSRSYLLGEQLIAQGTLQDYRLQTEISWRRLQSLLKKQGYLIPSGSEFDGAIQMTLEANPDVHLTLRGIDSSWRGMALPLHAECSENSGVWSVSSCQVGPFIAQCQFSRKAGEWRVENGLVTLHAQYPLEGSSSIAFEGKVNESFTLDAVIDHMKLDLAAFGIESLHGLMEGKGRVSLNSQLEADLDVSVTDVSWREYGIENNGPLCLSIHSTGHALVEGIECKINARGLQAHVSTDHLEIDWKRRSVKAKKIRVLSPTNFFETPIFDTDREIVLFGDVELGLNGQDGSNWACELQEGFLPLAGAVRHVKDCRMSSDAKAYKGSGRMIHRGKEALVSWILSDTAEGKVVLQEVGQDQAMVIEGSYKTINSGENALSIHSVEGKFAGVSASFRAVDSTHLVGSALINFFHLSEWIPVEVADVFHDLEMGAGYELKGSFTPKDSSFQGLLYGKEIDLFGFQLKTLMAKANLSATGIYLKDLLISDEAGSLAIPAISLAGETSPWTIDIPTTTIRDLRPSLLRKEGEEKKDLTPLVVRDLTIRNFRGLLEDGTTYRAEGDCFFINSFKRGKSVFDVATHLFGRIVGLDLELLIPVEGKLLFELKDGYFVLNELQDSFSEGRRSQFFLAEQPIQPRMSLRGDLEIFVRMKHFVLFALTEPFMISIDGKLSDPQFRLQKKKNL